MTIAPWSLPIRELRWGRAISDVASIVWIEWRGEHPLVLTVVDGDAHDAGEIADSHIATGDASVALSEARVLRDGAIGTTALASIPGLSRIAPLAWLGSRETKWVSRADIHTRAGTSRGWAIHEVVRFQGVA